MHTTLRLAVIDVVNHSDVLRGPRLGITSGLVRIMAHLSSTEARWRVTRILLGSSRAGGTLSQLRFGLVCNSGCVANDSLN